MIDDGTCILSGRPVWERRPCWKTWYSKIFIMAMVLVLWILTEILRKKLLIIFLLIVSMMLSISILLMLNILLDSTFLKFKMKNKSIWWQQGSWLYSKRFGQMCGVPEWNIF